MSTLLEIKQAAANYLNINIGDLTQNGQDLFLVAANEVRKQAELQNDFEFSRKTVSVTVNGLTGGNLGLAMDVDGNTYEIKTVIDAGLLDTTGNLYPVEWTTTSESLTRQREDNVGAWPRYPTDGYAQSTPWGGIRFTFSGDQIMKWPLVTETNATNYPLFLEAYTFGTDWVDADLTPYQLNVSGTLSPDVTGVYSFQGLYLGQPFFFRDLGTYQVFKSSSTWYIQSKSASFTPQTNTFSSLTATPAGTYTAGGSNTGTATVTQTNINTSNIWTTHGQKYLLWATLVQLNHIWRRWVARQEGNLPPPTQLAEEGLQSLIQWDAYRFEAFRTHNR